MADDDEFVDPGWFDEEEENGGDDESSDIVAAKQHVLMLVDCGPNMTKDFLPSPDFEDDTTSPLQLTMQAIQQVLERKVRQMSVIKTGKADKVGVYLYDTRLTTSHEQPKKRKQPDKDEQEEEEDDDDHGTSLLSNEPEKSTCHKILDLCTPDKTAILTIQSTIDDGFGADLDLVKEYGHEKDGGKENALYDAMRMVPHILSEAPGNNRTKQDNTQTMVWIFTNNDHPVVGAKTTDAIQSLLKEGEKADVVVWPLPKPDGTKFDFEIFWKNIQAENPLSRRKDEDDQDAEKSSGNHKTVLTDLVQEMLDYEYFTRPGFALTVPLRLPNFMDDNRGCQITVDLWRPVSQRFRPSGLDIHNQTGQALGKLVQQKGYDGELITTIYTPPGGGKREITSHATVIPPPPMIDESMLVNVAYKPSVEDMKMSMDEDRQAADMFEKTLGKPGLDTKTAAWDTLASNLVIPSIDKRTLWRTPHGDQGVKGSKDKVQMTPEEKEAFRTRSSANYVFAPQEKEEDDSSETGALDTTKGLILLGFKDKDAFPFYRTMGKAFIAVPNEAAVEGSGMAFANLHASMLRKGVLAVGELLTSYRGKPRLVAMHPVEDGLAVIELPYEDDTRFLGPDEATKALQTGEGAGLASEELVKAAMELIDKQTRSDAELGVDFVNADLTRFWDYIEHVALGKPRSGKKNFDSEINREEVLKLAGEEIEAFKALLPEDIPKKRGGDAKPKKIVPDETGIDWEEQYAEDTIGKCNMNQLKAYLRSKGLAVSGKKPELVDRVTKQIEKELNAKNAANA